MKIRASVQLPEEYQDYQDLKRYLEQRHPRAKVRESDADPPQRVLYVTTGRGRKRKKSLTSLPGV